MRSFTWSLSLAVLVSAGSAAHSQDGLPDAKELFKQLDQNGDGKLVTDEIPQEQVKFFDRLLRIADKNDDRQLTEEEFLKAHEADDGPGLPLNGLGGGGRGRGPGDLNQRFDMLDRNKDGQITRDELPEFAREQLGRLFDRLGKDSLTKEDFSRLQGAIGGGERLNGERLFQQLDTNNDGKLSAADAPQDRAKRMLEQYLERTGQKPDAEISKADFLAQIAKWDQGRGAPDRPEGDMPGRPPAGGPVFMRLLDTNRDGRISKDEWSKAPELFSRLDANDDGELDPRELMGPPPEGMEPDGGRGPRTSAGSGPPPGVGQLGQQFFQRLDKDSDGKLSKDELPPRMQERFGQLDKDADGFVTPEELRGGFPGNRPDRRPESNPRESDSPEGKPRPRRPAAE